MVKASARYFVGLDCARFIAALLVTLFHLGYAIHVKGGRAAPLAYDLPRPSFVNTFAWGHIGVQAFFVISGLVIANSAMRSAPWHFFRSRLERLYPAVWICAPLSFLAWMSAPSVNVGDTVFRFVKSMTLFPFLTWIDAPYWTLGHEIVFYAIVLVYVWRSGAARLDLLGYAIALFSALFWVAYALNQFHIATIPHIRFLSSGAGRMFVSYYGCYFALGMILWAAAVKGFTPLRWAMLFLSYVTCLAALYIEPVLAGRNVWPEVCAWVILSIMIIYSTFGRLTPGNRNAQALRQMGLVTYPLYLVHFAPGIIIIRQLFHLTGNIDLATVATVILLVAAAWAISAFGEPWIRSLIRRTLDGLEKRVPSTPAKAPVG